MPGIHRAHLFVEKNDPEVEYEKKMALKAAKFSLILRNASPQATQSATQHTIHNANLKSASAPTLPGTFLDQVGGGVANLWFDQHSS